MSVLHRHTPTGFRSHASPSLTALDILWVTPGDLLGLATREARFGWTIRPLGESAAEATPILPDGLGLNGRTPKTWTLRVTRDGSFVHLDADEPDAPRCTLEHGPGGWTLLWARSDLPARLGLLGGRYEPIGVVAG